MKSVFSMICGAFGSFLTYLFGGWDSILLALIVFMAIDYITGSILALVFHKSPKSESGAYESRKGFKGLCRKFIILFFVIIGHILDNTLGFDYIKNFVCIAFMTNELLSIIENAGLMGVPIPKVITNAIELLKKKTEGETAHDETDDLP